MSSSAGHSRRREEHRFAGIKTSGSGKTALGRTIQIVRIARRRYARRRTAMTRQRAFHGLEVKEERLLVEPQTTAGRAYARAIDSITGEASLPARLAGAAQQSMSGKAVYEIAHFLLGKPYNYFRRRGALRTINSIYRTKGKAPGQLKTLILATCRYLKENRDKEKRPATYDPRAEVKVIELFGELALKSETFMKTNSRLKNATNFVRGQAFFRDMVRRTLMDFEFMLGARGEIANLEALKYGEIGKALDPLTAEESSAQRLRFIRAIFDHHGPIDNLERYQGLRERPKVAARLRYQQILQVRALAEECGMSEKERYLNAVCRHFGIDESAVRDDCRTFLSYRGNFREGRIKWSELKENLRLKALMKKAHPELFTEREISWLQSERDRMARKKRVERVQRLRQEGQFYSPE